MRLNKYLAAAGVCSRREADRFIEQGLVSVNGQRASVGMQVEGNETICLKGERVEPPTDRLVIKFYKPAGVDCTKRDKYAKTTVFDLIQTPVSVNYAGRLDRDSEGLLLLTNDGGLIHSMMRGAAGHEKEYEVTVDKPVTEEFLQQLQNGIYLKELDRTSRKCKVIKQSQNSFVIVLTQGMNRQIRRMCEACGYMVQSLRRTRVVNITLDGLERGQWKELSDRELSELLEIIGYQEGSEK